jgi:uncharacterized protein (TIGR02453 family)
MIQRSTFDFLKGLKRNNNREWFAKNRSRYEDALYDFHVFINALIQKTSEFDPTVKDLLPKDCIFRIYRDIRFSKDKTPYKWHFGAVIGIGGRRSDLAGYYVQIAPGEVLTAGGLYSPSPAQTLAVRKTMLDKTERIRSIINDKEFKKYFGELRGDKLKTVPKGFPKDHKAIELLKLKSYVAYHEIGDEKAFSKSFVDYTAKTFRAAMPLINFLNDAVKGVSNFKPVFRVLSG